MKKTLFYIFLTFSSLSFGQVYQSGVLKIENSIDELLHFKNSRHSLNLDFFELNKNTTIWKNIAPCESFIDLIKCEEPRLMYTFPLFSPNGAFFLKTLPTDNNTKHDQEIYDFVEPKYYFRSVG